LTTTCVLPPRNTQRKGEPNYVPPKRVDGPGVWIGKNNTPTFAGVLGITADMPTTAPMSGRVRVSAPTRLLLVMALSVGLVGGLGFEAVAGAASIHATRATATPKVSAADPAKVAEYMAEGFSNDEAVFLALTKASGRAVGHRQVEIAESFPTGNTASISITVTPATSGTPGPVNVKSQSSNGAFEFSLEYFVSYDTIPADARATIVAFRHQAMLPAVLVSSNGGSRS
jgi:hypothetical protein